MSDSLNLNRYGILHDSYVTLESLILFNTTECPVNNLFYKTITGGEGSGRTACHYPGYWPDWITAVVQEELLLLAKLEANTAAGRYTVDWTTVEDWIDLIVLLCTYIRATLVVLTE